MAGPCRRPASVRRVTERAPSPQLLIRGAAADDAPALSAIYNEGIEDRVGTFQTWPSTRSDFADRVRCEEPLLVAQAGGEVLGWAGIVPYSERPFYAGVGEYQVYVARSARGQGVGTALLTELVSAAEGRGYWKLVGKLFATNAASIALALRCGFREVGVHLRHGRLDGEWRDVVVVERSIA
jgi:L-amino acid N-acyltransferase YncA